MSKPKNPKRNQYQILIIICVVLFFVYGYSFYIACRLHNHFKMWLHGGLALLWCICGILWWILLKRLNKNDNVQ